MRLLKAQYFALSKSEGALYCFDQIKGVEKQLDLVCEKVMSVGAVGAAAAVRSNGELARV